MIAAAPPSARRHSRRLAAGTVAQLRDTDPPEVQSIVVLALGGGTAGR